jgi:hypothetical protein
MTEQGIWPGHKNPEADARWSNWKKQRDKDDPLPTSNHVLLRKSPWVEKAEHNELPAKELKP